MIRFTVYGRAEPQGSKRAFWKKGMKYAVTVDDNEKVKPWRQEVSRTALNLGVPMLSSDGPIIVSIDFFFKKPKSVKRLYPSVKPDVDKLARATFDALSGILFKDDAQIVGLNARKFYSDLERAEIELHMALADPLSMVETRQAQAIGARVLAPEDAKRLFGDLERGA